MINNRLVARGYRARRILRKLLSTANQSRLYQYWTRRWQNWTVGAWSSGEMSHIFSCTLSMAAWEFVDRRVNASSKTARMPGSKLGVYWDIWDNLVPFDRQHFGDHFRYQDDNATPHFSRVVTDYLQQEEITKMDQPAQYPDCNPIEHLWDELGHAINNMDHSPWTPPCLLDQWANIPVERLQRLVASMLRRLAVIIRARGLNTLRPRQNGRHFPDDIFKCIYLNELRFEWSLFLMVQLTISQHWFR